MTALTATRCDFCRCEGDIARYGWHWLCPDCLHDTKQKRIQTAKESVLPGYAIIKIPLRTSAGMVFDEGEIVSVSTLCLYAHLSILGALRVLWSAERNGTLERVNTMEYRTTRTVRFLRTVKRRT